MKTIKLLEKDGLSIETLTSLSYKTSLNKSLKRNLHYFDKDSLLKDVDDVICFLDNQGDLLENIAIDYRSSQNNQLIINMIAIILTH